MELLQILGEVYRLNPDRIGGALGWTKKSSGLAPITVVCKDETPVTVLQVTAIEPPNKTILDCKIFYPGTQVLQSNNCFVHWSDKINGGFWGVNFISERDTFRFIASCSQTHGTLRGSTTECHSNYSPIQSSYVMKNPKQSQLAPFPGQRRSYVHEDASQQGSWKSDGIRLIGDTLVVTAAPGLCGPFSSSYATNSSIGKGGWRYSEVTSTSYQIKDCSVSSYEQIPDIQPKFEKRTTHERSQTRSSPYKTDDVLLPCQHVYADVHARNQPSLPPLPNPKLFDSLPSVPNQIELENFGGIPTLEDSSEVDDVEVLDSPDFKDENPVEEDDDDLRSLCHPTDETILQKEVGVELHCSNASLDYMCGSSNNSLSYSQLDIVEHEVAVTLEDVCSAKMMRNSLLSQSDSGFEGISHESGSAKGVSHDNEHKDQHYSDITNAHRPRFSPKLREYVEDSDDSSSDDCCDQDDTVRSFIDCGDISDDNHSEVSGNSNEARPSIRLPFPSAEAIENTVKPNYRNLGVTRKAGWLDVKHLLMLRKRKLETAPKRKWKKYWSCLKGTSLLFYAVDDNKQISIEELTTPDVIFDIEGSIAQPIPEHPKRDNVFSLSTSSGDVFLMEACSQVELESWINGIHSTCSASLARQKRHDDTLALILEEIKRKEAEIKLEADTKKMAELQLTATTDQKNRQVMISHINDWEQNIQKLHCEVYRLRCYAASLQGSELPNPKTLLAAVSRDTKNQLSKLGCFSASSVHALLSGRQPEIPIVNPNNQGSLERKRKTSIVSWNKDCVPTNPRSSKEQIPHGPPRSQSIEPEWQDRMLLLANVDSGIAGGLSENAVFQHRTCGQMAKVLLPRKQWIACLLTPNMTVQDLLLRCCSKAGLDPNNHFIRLKLFSDDLSNGKSDEWVVPCVTAVIETLQCREIHVVPKKYQSISLQRKPNERFGIEYETVEERDSSGLRREPRLFIRDVLDHSIACNAGLQPGDEILEVNGDIIKNVDVDKVDQLLKCDTLILYLRSLQTPSTSLSRASDCSGDSNRTSGYGGSDSGDQRKSIVSDQSDPSSSSSEKNDKVEKGRKELQRLCLLIKELVKTEESYVKDLVFLIDYYLEPLLRCSFITEQENSVKTIYELTSSAHDIAAFQHSFCDDLKRCAGNTELEIDCSVEISHLKTILEKIGHTFINYTDRFKLYSAYCAIYSKAQKILLAVQNVPEYRFFMDERNPSQEHCKSLESYLIKPIQRVLKYPLLLREINALIGELSGGKELLCTALRSMENVAEHINDIKRIHEEYGEIFEQLIMEQDYSGVNDLPIDELLIYGSALWCNCPDDILSRKQKHGNEVEVMIFVFKRAVVMLANPKKKTKKKRLALSAPVKGEEGSLIKYLLPSTHLEVKSYHHKDSERFYWDIVAYKHEFTIVRQVTFKMCSRSVDNKQHFIKAIKTSVREATALSKSVPNPERPGRSSSQPSKAFPRMYSMPQESNSDQEIVPSRPPLRSQKSFTAETINSRPPPPIRSSHTSSPHKQHHAFKADSGIFTDESGDLYVNSEVVYSHHRQRSSSPPIRPPNLRMHQRAKSGPSIQPFKSVQAPGDSLNHRTNNKAF